MPAWIGSSTASFLFHFRILTVALPAENALAPVAAIVAICELRAISCELRAISPRMYDERVYVSLSKCAQFLIQSCFSASVTVHRAGSRSQGGKLGIV